MTIGIFLASDTCCPSGQPHLASTCLSRCLQTNNALDSFNHCHTTAESCLQLLFTALIVSFLLILLIRQVILNIPESICFFLLKESNLDLICQLGLYQLYHCLIIVLYTPAGLTALMRLQIFDK
ncbi:hypothetical protein BDB01DRAFT_810362 [Pilobolus umbonatus]|nr:hypothetical protein BDB01DRAFT_810362 [Pilobolus umbonatus]